MREIKFRAWDELMQSMNEVYSLDKIYIRYTEPNTEDMYECPRSKVNIMQFTGLKDKNGVEIYEGDICKVLNYASDYLRNTGKMRCVIEWSNTCGFFGQGFGLPTSFAMGEEFEVIGNIYENKELLGD